jgi:hypothetical protein
MLGRHELAQLNQYGSTECLGLIPEPRVTDTVLQSRKTFDVVSNGDFRGQCRLAAEETVVYAAEAGYRRVQSSVSAQASRD